MQTQSAPMHTNGASLDSTAVSPHTAPLDPCSIDPLALFFIRNRTDLTEAFDVTPVRSIAKPSPVLILDRPS